MKKYSLICILILLFFIEGLAQDSLPKIKVINVNTSVLITWNNPFTTLTNISVQRSIDSTKYFQTIGEVLNVRNTKDGYVDQNPPAINMYYRLFLSFEGGAYLFTPSYRPGRSSEALILPNYNRQEVLASFKPSKYIYPGRDNAIVIFLPDAAEKKYSIKFYEQDGSFLFEVPHVKEPHLILEKVNFMHSGVFNYELFKEGVLLEKYKVFVAKDPKKP